VTTKDQHWHIESKYSGDKQANAGTFFNIQGEKITSEVIISKVIYENTLRATPKQIASFCLASSRATIQSGAIGAQVILLMGLRYYLLLVVKMVACIVEYDIGLTRMEVIKRRYICCPNPSRIDCWNCFTNTERIP